MATEVYKIQYVKTVNDVEIEIIPLRIKYMRQLMDVFVNAKNTNSDEETLDILCDCVRISMKQYCPELSLSVDQILDNFDIDTLYDILDFSVGIKINRNNEEGPITKSSSKEEDSGWESFDLLKLETEVFLLGIWKNYDELETYLSIPELMATISNRRELDYEEKKFLAAIQGVDLDAESGSDKGQKEWEDLKARVFSGGATSDSNDILALQGQNAVKAGFGIGFGLDYEDARDPAVML